MRFQRGDTGVNRNSRRPSSEKDGESLVEARTTPESRESCTRPGMPLKGGYGLKKSHKIKRDNYSVKMTESTVVNRPQSSAKHSAKDGPTSPGLPDRLACHQPQKVLLGLTSEDVGATQPPNQRGHITLLTWEPGASGSWAPDPSSHRGSVNEHTELIDFDRSTNTQHTSEPALSQDRSPSPTEPRDGCEVPTF
ncbi:hypothetical protein MJG53_013031 [Ovis ammon polii x Ovis aries]|uniref:Uncharacterized protein n=1 Tax=Ovis ammon polii x Ovis aries TaxID=2918886 RepID=A0ACB9UM93_9CETA|nr:hypothetical protein MJG53_013031 [Ovis ammon polii x Ovis aries]